MAGAASRMKPEGRYQVLLDLGSRLEFRYHLHLTKCTNELPVQCCAVYRCFHPETLCCVVMCGDENERLVPEASSLPDGFRRHDCQFMSVQVTYATPPSDRPKLRLMLCPCN